jgi:anti-anti-sigma regulatory factor
MSHTRYAGSAALGVIIAAQKRIKSSGGKMVMVQSDPIAQLLKVARTQSIFTAAPNLNEAVRMLQR